MNGIATPTAQDRILQRGKQDFITKMAQRGQALQREIDRFLAGIKAA